MNGKYFLVQTPEDKYLNGRILFCERPEQKEDYYVCYSVDTGYVTIDKGLVVEVEPNVYPYSVFDNPFVGRVSLCIEYVPDSRVVNIMKCEAEIRCGNYEVEVRGFYNMNQEIVVQSRLGSTGWVAGLCDLDFPVDMSRRVEETFKNVMNVIMVMSHEMDGLSKESIVAGVKGFAHIRDISFK